MIKHSDSYILIEKLFFLKEFVSKVTDDYIPNEIIYKIYSKVFTCFFF